MYMPNIIIHNNTHMELFKLLLTRLLFLLLYTIGIWYYIELNKLIDFNT